LPDSFTSVFAKLLSSSVSRSSFHQNPSGFVRQFELSAEDAQSLLLLDRKQLDHQAKSLLKKRYFELKHYIPRTLEGDQKKIMGWFFEYGESFWPEGPRKHLIDAQKFLGDLNARKWPQVNRFERLWVNFMLDGKRIKVGFCSDFHIQKNPWWGFYMMWKRSDGVACFRILPFIKKTLR
jgi:hypothetical protein